MAINTEDLKVEPVHGIIYRFTCPICKKVYESMYRTHALGLAYMHFAKHQKKETNEQGTTYIFTCKYCKKVYKSVYKNQLIGIAYMHLTKHMKKDLDSRPISDLNEGQ